jgi:hypothetical protein
MPLDHTFSPPARLGICSTSYRERLPTSCGSRFFLQISFISVTMISTTTGCPSGMADRCLPGNAAKKRQFHPLHRSFDASQGMAAQRNLMRDEHQAQLLLLDGSHRDSTG